MDQETQLKLCVFGIFFSLLLLLLLLLQAGIGSTQRERT
jgi:hypothetical protein